MKIMRAVLSGLVIYVVFILTSCHESPDCVHFRAKQYWQRQFILIDKVTGENLLMDYEIQNPKRIHLDSLELFSPDLVKFPDYQWSLEAHGPAGYAIVLYIFDQSKMPNVDVYTPGSTTYYLYSGSSDYDTIVFDYSFERGKYCYSETNDTVACYINGKPAAFSSKALIKDVYAIEK